MRRIFLIHSKLFQNGGNVEMQTESGRLRIKGQETNNKDGGLTISVMKVPAGNRYAFVACSAGARSRADQRFAMDEIIVSLSTLLKHFKFEPPRDFCQKIHSPGLVQCPEDGIPMKII
jgi:hypothetical protein